MSFKNQLHSIKFLEDSNYYFGLILAVTSSLFIGSSFIIKKKALIQLNRKGCLRAGSGGFGYLKEWIWWIGLLCMGIGELSNFAAYAFAPASLVTPLGALSVLVSAILSSIYLKEHLNILGKLGCILCLLGSTIIVIHSPTSEKHENLASFSERLHDSTFMLYVSFIIIFSFLIIFHFGPKYGNRNVIWYVILCSGIGSLTVISCKALGLALRDAMSQQHNHISILHSWQPYSLVLNVIICVTIQMIYLNRALDFFNTSIVTPIYYVFFTTLVLLASSILLNEWERLSYLDIVGNICGFLVVIIAVVLLNAFKNFDINFSDLQCILRSKRDLISNDSKNSYNFNQCIDM